MSADNVTYKRVNAARKEQLKTSQSYFSIKTLGDRMVEYAAANRIPNGELVDMAFLEFLEKRGIVIAEIPQAADEA